MYPVTSDKIQITDIILKDGQLTCDAYAAERIRAHFTHDAHGGSMERKHWNDSNWLPVITEELGEVARCLCEFHNGKIAINELREQLEIELIQTGAMVTAWIAAINRAGATNG